MASQERSGLLTLRVPAAVERRIAQEARRRRATKSALVREVLEGAFGARDRGSDIESEARRQSLLVSRRASERDALRFVERAADVKGWK
jgi:hypothetical protein